ncbi:spondin domain-containing protein [Ancylomarina longa]|uniref:Spondin domain-containing protein n=1 Tax=Ancylomarina longa TaxID=2487017 RepID=A0A434ATB9_9BACT|nr:spondin domain-containing protein [Ancylomarina longa]RUT77648.1 hypothetical protein DLK05_12005 [Ancylomarina longa]
MKKLLLFTVASIFLLSACNNDDDDENVIPTPKKGMFTVRVENVQQAKDFFASGMTDAVGPGSGVSFSFNAGKGAHLSFAAMFVQSNDLFYAFADSGLALYDSNGNAVSGDVTNQVMLWDAGTEVNQEPGVGSDQAPRQLAANTGTAENGTVKMLSDVMDGFTYPATADVIQVVISHDGGTTFTLTLNNVSDQNAFQTPLAPGVWVVHNSGMPIFTSNMAAANGLEGLAEDGANSDTGTYLADNSGYVSPFAPGVFAIHTSGNPLFTNGEMQSGNGLEALAEDGSPADLDNSLVGLTGVVEHGVFSVPVGASAGAPIFPGGMYEFSFEASEGDYLSIASMLVQSNDLFVSFDDMGIALFNNGQPLSGDLTAMLMLRDAGTEQNEFPGAGNNQAPRQVSANTGVDEAGNVGLVNDSFTYPAVGDLIKVTISSN